MVAVASALRRLKEEKLKRLREKDRARAEAPPIPEPINPLPTMPRSLEELTGGVVTQPLAAGLGGVTGTAVGAGSGLLTGPFAPATSPAGATVGGTLGAVGGTVLFRNAEDLLRQMGFIDKPPLTIGGLAQEGLEEAALDATVAGLGTVVRPILGARAVLGKLFGVGTERADDLIRAAKDAGLSVLSGGKAIPAVGAADVGGQVPKTIVKALGVFPFTGTPAFKNLATKQKLAGAKLATLVDDLAPSASLRNELGVDLAQSAKLRTKAFNRLIGRLSTNLEAKILGASNQEIIPTDATKQLTADLLKAIEDGEIVLTSGKTLEGPVPNQVTDFLLQLQDLPDTITLPQYRSFMDKLRDLMDAVQDAGGQFSEAGKIKQALEVDFNNLRTDLLPEGEARAIQTALDGFNSTYAKGMTGFDTATARKFNRIDKNVFKAGPRRPMSLPDDQIGDIALNTNSKQAIDELEAVVGKGALKRAGRFHVENALRLSTEPRQLAGEAAEVIDPFRLERELGLGTRREQTEGLAALLKRAGVDLDEFRSLLEVMKSLESPGDPSTFVKRRVILGGAQGLAGIAGAGAAIGAGAGAAAGTGLGGVTIVATSFLARRFTDIVTNPIALNGMRTALDTTLETTARRQGLVRALTAVARDTKERREDKSPRTRGSFVSNAGIRG